MDKNKTVLRSDKMKNISYQESALLSSISVTKESDIKDLETFLKETQTALNYNLIHAKMIGAPAVSIKKQIQPILEQI